jgi:HEPN domain-containing protein
LRRRGVAEDLLRAKEDLLELAEDLLDGGISADTPDEARAQAYLRSALGEALETVGGLWPREEGIAGLWEKAYQEASTYEDLARELEPAEGDDSDGEPWSAGGSAEFDIDGLFADF